MITGTFPIPPAKPPGARIFFAHLLLLMISLPFDRMYSHLVLISFSLQMLISLIVDTRIPGGWRSVLVQWKSIMLPAAIFFCTTIGLLYSPRPEEGRKEALLQLPLLLMPLLLLPIAPSLKRYRNTMMMIFSLVSAATAVYLFANAFWTIRHFSLPWSVFFSFAFTNHNFSEPIKMHATYLSMQWALAFVFLLQELLRRRGGILRWLFILAAGILLAGLLQLCSKSVGGAMLVIAFTGWPVMGKNGPLRRRAVFLSVSVLALLLGIVAAKPAFRSRYLSDLRSDFVKPVAGELAEPRVARWMAAMEIAKTSPLLGQGAGTEKAMLHEVFFRRKYYNSFLNHLNIHSQYLSLFFKNGITGLLAYLLVLGAGFRQAISRRDLMYYSFMIVVALVSLGENILDLDKGVYFYSLFFSFFIFFPEPVPATQPTPGISRNHKEQRPVSKPAVIIDFARNNS